MARTASREDAPPGSPMFVMFEYLKTRNEAWCRQPVGLLWGMRGRFGDREHAGVIGSVLEMRG